MSERFFKKDLLNFFITKYLKKKIDDDLTVGTDEHCKNNLLVVALYRLFFNVEDYRDRGSR